LTGIKRHLVVDAHGHPLNFTISCGNHHDQRHILETIDGIRIGKRKRRPKRVGLDKGYDSEPLRQALRQRRIVPIAPYRKNHVTVPRGRPPKDRVEKRYCCQRWKVERCFAWANRFRRLDRLLEHGQKAYRAFVRVFFIRHYLNLLY
jgi:transposase